MSFTRPTPTREHLPLAHLTWSARCQMRDIVVVDEEEYVRAAKQITLALDGQQIDLDTLVENLKIACCHGGEKPLAHPGLVAEYFAVLGLGQEFKDDLEVVKEPAHPSTGSGLTYWGFSGFTRAAAYALWEVERVWCIVYPGTVQDAEFFALSENRMHGVRRSPGDKTNAIRKLLAMPAGMEACRAASRDRSVSLAITMADACKVSPTLVRYVLEKDDLRVQGLQIVPIEYEPDPPPAEDDMEVFRLTDAVEVEVIPSEPEPIPTPEAEATTESSPEPSMEGNVAFHLTDGRESGETPVTPDPQQTSETQSHSPIEPKKESSEPKASSNGQLPPLVPHMFAALMADTKSLARKYTKAIRAQDQGGERLRAALGACKMLDFVPERKDPQTGEVTPKHVDFIILRGLVKVLDLAGGEAKPTKIAHEYQKASGGFVPPAHVRRKKVKGKGGK